MVALIEVDFNETVLNSLRDDHRKYVKNRRLTYHAPRNEFGIICALMARGLSDREITEFFSAYRLPWYMNLYQATGELGYFERQLERAHEWLDERSS